MRIGIDAMGCDHAPAEEVKGALSARPLLAPQDRLVLIGPEDVLRQHLGAAAGWQDFIEIRHASQAIGMNEAPVEALKTKPDSSMAVLTRMHRAGDVDAAVSAGNTGAFAAAAQMFMRRLKGVLRPGIAVPTPTLHGPLTICDVGANISCRPQHLHQYAVMASLYATAIGGQVRPRVGLLSIGAEDTKGNELVKKARDLLRDEPSIHFVGNVEGRDLCEGVCDVVICDGFVGNVVLKLMEGLGQSILRGFIEDLRTSMPEHLESVQRAAGQVMARYDSNEHGGAPLLGVAGICIICHGSSNHVGIKNGVRVAKEFAQHRVNDLITKILSNHSRTAHE